MPSATRFMMPSFNMSNPESANACRTRSTDDSMIRAAWLLMRQTQEDLNSRLWNNVRRHMLK